MATTEGRKPHRIKPSPKQKQAFRIIFPKGGKQVYTDILFDGGARGGKTFIICWAMVLACLRPEWGGMRVLIARYKYNHAVLSIWKQTLIPMVKKFFPGLFHIDESYKILTSPFGSQIWLGGLDDKERTEKIFGTEFAVIFLNEVVQVSQTTLIKVQTRLAQKVPGFRNFMIYDCNPRSPAHYIYRMFYVEKKPERVRLTFTPFDNLDNIGADFIARLDQMPETERKRFRDGEWCEVEGAVYGQILDIRKIKANRDWAAYDYVVGGIDWGYHAHVSVWGIKGRRATCIFGKEIIGGKTSQVIRYLKTLPAWVKRDVTFYCDHENDRIDEAAEAGYNAVQAYKEVGAGDSSVNDAELWFDEEAEDTFQSMLNLMRQQDKEGNYTDQHVKVNDHGADSARYAIHGGRRDNPDDEDLDGGEHFLKKRVI
jgi:phage terminase large subunit